MQVLLIKPVPKLGPAGAVKEVSEGYARNYLFPNKLAVAATSERLAEVEAAARRKKKEQERQEKTAAKLQTTLQGKRFQMKAEANAQGTLFAGVTADAIRKHLETQGYEVSLGTIELPHPLKHIGEHTVAIRFPGVNRPVTVIIEIIQ